MIDYQSALLDPIYLTLGVPCFLTLGDAREFDTLTAIDKTSGVEIFAETGTTTQTVKPGATFRVAELREAGIALDDLEDAVLELNEYRWQVDSWLLKPNPGGENNGEVLLLLSNKQLVESESESV